MGVDERELHTALRVSLAIPAAQSRAYPRRFSTSFVLSAPVTTDFLFPELMIKIPDLVLHVDFPRRLFFAFGRS